MERLVLSASKDEAKQPFFPKSGKMTKVLLSTTSPRKCNFLYFFFLSDQVIWTLNYWNYFMFILFRSHSLLCNFPFFNYRKIPRDLTEASLSGAGLSIIAALSMMFLFGMVSMWTFYFFLGISSFYFVSKFFVSILVNWSFVLD